MQQIEEKEWGRTYEGVIREMSQTYKYGFVYKHGESSYVCQLGGCDSTVIPYDDNNNLCKLLQKHLKKHKKSDLIYLLANMIAFQVR